MTAADDAKRAAIDRLWAAVEAAPHDESANQKLIRFAVDNEAYLPAIEHYKALAAQRPEHAELAAKWQKQIAGQAAAKVLVRAPQEKPSMSRGGRLMLALLALMTLAVFGIQCLRR